MNTVKPVNQECPNLGKIATFSPEYNPISITKLCPRLSIKIMK